MTVSSTWKNVERRVAAFFGSRRTPLSGGNSGHTRSDSLHDLLFVECKWRAKHSAVSLWRETAKLAKQEQKIPVIALCEKNKPGFWIMCHSSDLQGVAACHDAAVREQRGLPESHWGQPSMIRVEVES